MRTRALVLSLLALVPAARAQEERPAPACTIDWQRSLDDALALSRASGKPILVCVNTDGETASEAFATKKYTSAELARLVEGFVPVILSPDRHTPQDHDERGRRIPCPRFGSVTCGEHIAMEPRAYALWFEKRRVAPRHVGIAPSGDKLFDLYLLQDLSVVDQALREHGVATPARAPEASLASRDARDRTALEDEYVAADSDVRAHLLQRAADSAAEPFELLRLGLHDQDAGLRSLARAALARTATASAADLVLEEVSRAPLEERAVLAPVLERLAAADPRVARARKVQGAIAAASPAVDVEAWLAALSSAGTAAGAGAPLPDVDTLGPEADELATRTADAHGDPELELQLGWKDFELAMAQLQRGAKPNFSLLDARQAAQTAGEHGAGPDRLAALQACCAWWLGDTANALALATRAVPRLVARAGEREAAWTLEVLARASAEAVRRADAAGEPWDDALLANADAAFRVLARHPFASARLAAAHADLLAALGLWAEERLALEAALTLAPSDADLHARLRAVVEGMEGVGGLGREYARLRVTTSDRAAIDWFHGYALLVVAERRRKEADSGSAFAAYDDALRTFRASVAERPEYADTADHFCALALGGEARLALQGDDLPRATDFLIEAIRRRPASAELQDGLGTSALRTLGDLRAKLRGPEQEALREKLESAVQEAAPGLLERAGS